MRQLDNKRTCINEATVVKIMLAAWNESSLMPSHMVNTMVSALWEKLDNCDTQVDFLSTKIPFDGIHTVSCMDCLRLTRDLHRTTLRFQKYTDLPYCVE